MRVKTIELSEHFLFSAGWHSQAGRSCPVELDPAMRKNCARSITKKSHVVFESSHRAWRHDRLNESVSGPLVSTFWTLLVMFSPR